MIIAYSKFAINARNFFALVLLYALSVTLNAHAAPVQLENTPNYYVSLVKQVTAFIDHDRNLCVEDVIQHPQRFNVIKTPYLDLGLSSGRVWVKTSLQNASNASGVWRFDINRQYY